MSKNLQCTPRPSRSLASPQHGPLRMVLLAVCAGLPLVSPFAAQAATSDWVTVKGGAVRLIAVAQKGEQATYKAGVEIRLQPGWHTYWKFPGEAGIPTEVDTSASENIANAKLSYPAPKRWFDGYSTSIVYHDDVILPLAVTPKAADQAVTLSAKVSFGVCKDICAPANADLSLRLTPDMPDDATSANALTEANARVPHLQTTDGLRIVSLELDKQKSPADLVIRADVGAAKKKQIDLFAVGPQGSYNAVPHFEDLQSGVATWRLSTDGIVAPETAKSGSTAKDAIMVPIDLVLTAGNRAVETTRDIPASSLPAAD